MPFVSNAPDSTDGFLFFLATGGVSSQLLLKQGSRPGFLSWEKKTRWNIDACSWAYSKMLLLRVVYI